MERKRKHSDDGPDDGPDERICKKLDVLNSHLMHLYNTDDNFESEDSVIATGSDVVSFSDDRLEQEFDNEDEGNYNEGNYNDSCIEEVPREVAPVEEIDLSDDELSKIWEESSKQSNEDNNCPDEDVVFINEEAVKENGVPENPCSSFHANIRETWTVWTRAGIPFKDKEALMKQYNPPQFLKPPKVNPEILETLARRPIERDEFVRSSQEMIGVALTALGSVMTTLISDNEIDKLKTLITLNDTAKILTSVFHLDTDKRRSNIISWKPKPIQKLLVSTKPDLYLFGKNLKGRIKQAEDSGRIAKLKPYVFQKNNNRPYRYFPSPYHWFPSQDDEKNEIDFVMNPLKKESVCKLEKVDKDDSIKSE